MNFHQVIRAAIAQDNLDIAVRTVQQAIGVDDGGYASMFFSDMADDAWGNMERRERLHKLWDYAKGEMLWAANY